MIEIADSIMSNSDNLEKLEQLTAMFKGTALTMQELSRILSDHGGDLNASIMAIIHSQPMPKNAQKSTFSDDELLSLEIHSKESNNNSCTENNSTGSPDRDRKGRWQRRPSPKRKPLALIAKDEVLPLTDTHRKDSKNDVSPLSSPENASDVRLLRSFSADSGISSGTIDSSGSEGRGRWQKKGFNVSSQDSLASDQNRDDNSSRGGRRKFTFGNVLQKVNLYKMIGNLEENQLVADQLEQINRDNEEEEERKELVRQAEAACLRTIFFHLLEFLEKNQGATYEEWIQELHPENAIHKEDRRKLIIENDSFSEEDRETTIDHRFYVEDSDHRRIWNDHVRSIENENTNVSYKQVPARFITVFSKSGNISLKRILSKTEE